MKQSAFKTLEFDKILNKISNKEIKEKINELINIQKENNYDFLGIQNYIYKHDKRNKLNDIKINILINNEITSIGEIRKWKQFMVAIFIEIMWR